MGCLWENSQYTQHPRLVSFGESAHQSLDSDRQIFPRDHVRTQVSSSGRTSPTICVNECDDLRSAESSTKRVHIPIYSIVSDLVYRSNPIMKDTHGLWGTPTLRTYLRGHYVASTGSTYLVQSNKTLLTYLTTVTVSRLPKTTIAMLLRFQAGIESTWRKFLGRP